MLLAVDRAVFAALALAAAGCADVTTAEARRLVAGGAQLVDVRTPEEYAAGHLDGAVNLPLGDLPARAAPLRGRALVVYCHTGLRAARAVQLLRKAGFPSVYDLGAMDRWYGPRATPPPSLF